MSCGQRVRSCQLRIRPFQFPRGFQPVKRKGPWLALLEIIQESVRFLHPTPHFENLRRPERHGRRPEHTPIGFFSHLWYFKS